MGQTMCLATHHDSFSIVDRAPLEIVLKIFGYLDASDLCRCALVHSQWARLVASDVLWRTLCLRRVRVLHVPAAESLNLTWKQVYRIMSEFLYWFGVNGQRGVEMFLDLGLMEPSPATIGCFLMTTKGLDPHQIGIFIANEANTDIMKSFVQHHHCKGIFLAEALRNFLSSFVLPPGRANVRLRILEEFARHYHSSNPQTHRSADTVVLLVMSLMLLAADFNNPVIRNKMSKREFIKNMRTIEEIGMLQDYLGELYDYVFLQGLLRNSVPASRVYKCNAVRNQVSQTRDHRWELYPRVISMHT